MLRTERRPYRALAFLIVLLLFLPLSLYLMNGTMYLDPKAYIPFLPLLLLLCGGFLESLFARQIPLRSAMLLNAAVVALGLLFYDGTGIEQIAAVIDAPLLLIAVAVFYRWNKRWAVWGQVAAFSMLVCFSVNLNCLCFVVCILDTQGFLLSACTVISRCRLVNSDINCFVISALILLCGCVSST